MAKREVIFINVRTDDLRDVSLSVIMITEKLSIDPYMQERFPRLRKRWRKFIQSSRISLFLR